ncbi:hypothetical protein PIB30_043947 [Stylosanthes scabra]|uniref:BZIP domain-containing protein n=1 Tax=Stylosanthes scabra TaxID=79078 RepID=A0ABU6ZEH6_9FABA|nr:hypothetical protein [Stylosanthes scabra]
MGSSEMDKTPKEKESKTTPPASQEQSSATSTGTVNPDWSSFQAYSPIPPHGFMASSPQAAPYMWGVQHIMPPYGTPTHPYVAMYPHGGIYAHPSMPPGSYPFSPFPMPSPNGTPAAGIHSKSGESASEGSSEGSDANSQNDSQLKSGGRQDSYEDEPSQNGSSVHALQNGGLNTPHTVVNQTMSVIPITAAGTPGAVPGPTTNLNIGMDYWGTPTASNIPALRGKVPSTAVAGGMVAAGSRDSVQSQLWLQDERELKRQRRKQSNRESARRSRLRKQVTEINL